MGERLFDGGDCFKYFGQRGAIIRGRRLIEGRLLFEEIRYDNNEKTDNMQTYLKSAGNI